MNDLYVIVDLDDRETKSIRTERHMAFSVETSGDIVTLYAREFGDDADVIRVAASYTTNLITSLKVLSC